MMEEDDDFFAHESFGTTMENVPPPQVSLPKQQRAKQQQQPSNHKKGDGQPSLIIGNPKETKKKLMSLSTAMEKSQQSQQDIHDWDRKMGLKRSHSKTMRLSMRSRKKLRAMLKKQITASKKRWARDGGS